MDKGKGALEDVFEVMYLHFLLGSKVARELSLEFARWLIQSEAGDREPLQPSALRHGQTLRANGKTTTTKPPQEERNMDTMEEGRDAAGSPGPERAHEEGSGEAEVQVHAAAERGSPDYMDTRDRDKRSGSSSSSSSSSSDEEEEAKVEEVAKSEEVVTVEEVVKSKEVVTVEEVATSEEVVKVEEEVEVSVEVEVEDARGGSRRSSTSSASSASSASPGDPCDDPPIQPRVLEEEDGGDDDAGHGGLLTTYDLPAPREESVDYSLKALERVALEERSAAPPEPGQPDISLFVRVRHVHAHHI
ncbi:hypothetical protein EYF80_045630 [Liparis tanakae]|uniref:Uncharacterized protein n=1 Tax=Liparis tanakae TaxID=230148 RepID=A0A4Z2FTF9_9TELE|nr:hypothetical protein EYF80_045630 [Liparis tanakae]